MWKLRWRDAKRMEEFNGLVEDFIAQLPKVVKDVEEGCSARLLGDEGVNEVVNVIRAHKVGWLMCVGGVVAKRYGYKAYATAVEAFWAGNKIVAKIGRLPTWRESWGYRKGRILVFEGENSKKAFEVMWVIDREQYWQKIKECYGINGELSFDVNDWLMDYSKRLGVAVVSNDGLLYLVSRVGRVRAKSWNVKIAVELLLGKDVDMRKLTKEGVEEAIIKEVWG